jgi:hypothetical protein
LTCSHASLARKAFEPIDNGNQDVLHDAKSLSDKQEADPPTSCHV